jgi:hypothetical protein
VSLAVNTLAFALLFRDSKGTLPWKRRLPLFARFSLYAMSFVAAWPFFSPPLLERWNRAGFFWPLAGDLAQQCQQVMHSTEILGGTIIFYWSLAILVTFSVVRSRPRWVAFFFVVSIPASTRLTWEIGERCYRLLTL